MRIIDKIKNNGGKFVSLKDFANEYYIYHNGKQKNFFQSALNKLNILFKSQTGIQRLFLQDIINEFEKIIKAVPTEIPKLVNDFTTGSYAGLLYSSNSQTAFGRSIEIAFNYKAFRKSKKASWFSEKINIKSCLYCNAQFALTIGKDGRRKRLLFQLDHFYNKAKYPFLSLTLGNLIPSCSTCNNSKSKKDFTIRTHVHPFDEDANIKFKFYVDHEDLVNYLIVNRVQKYLTPKIKVFDKKYIDHKLTFNLENIYAKHTDYVEEILLKSIYYNKSRRREIAKEFSILNLSRSEIDRFVLGNYTLDSEINNRPLSKLSKDIGKQLKIIK